MKQLKFFCLLFFISSLSNHSFSQYILNGSAGQISCNCYTLTKPVTGQSGSVWNSNKISLDNSFDFHFNVYLGCLDANGADGVVFILQPISTSVGTAGEGLGFEGVSPSVGISLDTWQNFNRNDPTYDHISIQLNGNITHGSDLAGPVPASSSSDNIEDCNWHVLRITWDASSKTVTTYFDGQFRLKTQYDLVANVFNNDPMVYWGFSGATGGSYNLQQFCTSLNPVFITDLTDSATCIGKNVIFTDHSESFSAIQNFYWDFGDGTTSTLQNPPPHSYTIPGAYAVKHVITALDGCVSDSMKKTVSIGAKPAVDFYLYDTCTGKILGLADQSTSSFGAISQWAWVLDDMTSSTIPQPLFSGLLPGSHKIKLFVNSIYDCMSDTMTKYFSIHPSPVVSIGATNGCWKQPLHFSGLQNDNATTITQWNWKFGDGSSSPDQNPVHVYSKGGNKTIYLSALAGNGCVSRDTATQIFVDHIYVDAGRDTSVQSNIPFALGASISGDFNLVPIVTWSPAIGLNTIYGCSPMATLHNDQEYYLSAISEAGCLAYDSIKIRVFNFPGVLVPNAFTPNHDGLNDLLRPRYNGIKRLQYFAIYDRWGELVFKTSDMSRGWDGNVRGRSPGTETFIWIVSAEDFNGKNYQLRGTSTILK